MLSLLVCLLYFLLKILPHFISLLLTASFLPCGGQQRDHPRHAEADGGHALRAEGAEDQGHAV